MNLLVEIFLIRKFKVREIRKNFIILDNNDANEDIMEILFKQVRKIVDGPVDNPIGKKWIASELEKKKK